MSPELSRLRDLRVPAGCASRAILFVHMLTVTAFFLSPGFAHAEQGFRVEDDIWAFYCPQVGMTSKEGCFVTVMTRYEPTSVEFTFYHPIEIIFSVHLKNSNFIAGIFAPTQASLGSTSVDLPYYDSMIVVVDDSKPFVLDECYLTECRFSRSASDLLIDQLKEGRHLRVELAVNPEVLERLGVEAPGEPILYVHDKIPLDGFLAAFDSAFG